MDMYDPEQLVANGIPLNHHGVQRTILEGKRGQRMYQYSWAYLPKV